MCVGNWRGKERTQEIWRVHGWARALMSVKPLAPGCVDRGRLWGLQSGRASQMGAVNAVDARVSLPSWSPCCSDCQHPYFGWPRAVAWEDEPFKWQCGHVTRSRWVRVGVITRHCKSRLKMETCPPLNSGLCCKGCSEVQGLGFAFVCWEQCNTWGWRQPYCDLGDSTTAHLQPCNVLHVAWSSSGTTGWHPLVGDREGLPVNLQLKYAIINQNSFLWLMQSSTMH